MSSKTNNALCECGNPGTIRKYGGRICATCNKADDPANKRERAGRGYQAEVYRTANFGMTARR